MWLCQSLSVQEANVEYTDMASETKEETLRGSWAGMEQNEIPRGPKAKFSCDLDLGVEVLRERQKQRKPQAFNTRPVD